MAPDVSTVAALFIYSGRQSLGQAAQRHVTEDLQLSFSSFLVTVYGACGRDYISCSSVLVWFLSK